MKGETRMVAETLATYLELWDTEQRTSFLESLTCYLHNEGHTLQGNHELFDVEWLAKRMYAQRTGNTMNDLERASDATRQEYKEMAEVAIRSLPDLCDRIGARYVSAKAALETELERVRAMRDKLRKR